MGRVIIVLLLVLFNQTSQADDGFLGIHCKFKDKEYQIELTEEKSKNSYAAQFTLLEPGRNGKMKAKYGEAVTVTRTPFEFQSERELTQYSFGWDSDDEFLIVTPSKYPHDHASGTGLNFNFDGKVEQEVSECIFLNL